MMRQKALVKEEKGFTLLEIIMVVVILSILVGLAIPRYTGMMEKARGDDAVATLRLIYAGQRMYRLDTTIYSANLTGDGGLYPAYIENVTAPARTRYFTFNLTRDATFLNYTATATRSGGAYINGTIAINQTETITSGGGWPFDYE